MSTADDMRRRGEAMKIVARAICLASGPKPSCLCQGRADRCHALYLYGDYAAAGVAALQREGYLSPEPLASEAAGG